MLLAQSGAEATILTSLTRSWKMIANQTDRYVAIMKKDAAQRRLRPEHDPEKARPALDAGCVAVLPRDKRESVCAEVMLNQRAKAR
jgi:hypothetical protein